MVPRALTDVADGWGRLYGDQNPTLTYRITEGYLAPGDRLTGAQMTTATAASNVGSYSITQGTLGASSDYAMRFTGDALFVHERALRITADALHRYYGDANPTLTYTIGGAGLAANDTLVGALTSVATARSDVGQYPVADAVRVADAVCSVRAAGGAGGRDHGGRSVLMGRGLPGSTPPARFTPPARDDAGRSPRPVDPKAADVASLPPTRRQIARRSRALPGAPG